jgi:hypothetical protein
MSIYSLTGETEMQKMYDLEIMIPICSNGRFFERGNNLKKYALVNSSINHRVLVKLLLGPDDNFPGIETGWGPGIDVSLERYPFDWPAQKIYTYYSQIDPNRARWFAKVDDDTLTDVSGLIKNLNNDFDHDREHYLATILVTPGNEHRVDMAIWQALGFNEFNMFQSEKEGSIISQGTMKRILETPMAKKVMVERAKHPGGYGDVALALAARVAKIYPTKAWFLCEQPYFHRFSLWGGYLNHLHFTYATPEITAFWKNKFDNENQELKNRLVGHKYILEKPTMQPIPVELNPAGAVMIQGTSNSIGCWVAKNNGEIDMYAGWPGAVVLNFDLFDPDYTRLEDRKTGIRLENM